MFLHSGASLHGHEYSRPASTSPYGAQQRKTPLLRSAFAKPLARQSPNSESDSLPRQRPRRPLSEVYNRPVSEVLPGRFLDDQGTPSPVVRFKEPETIQSPEPMSEDEPSSLYDSDTSQQSTISDRRKKRRAPKESTKYLLAKPAPRPTRRKQLLIQSIRPRILMQLQQLSADRRPRPTIDVYPSSRIAGPLVATRYVRRFPGVFGIKGELGLHDTILVKSEDYDSAGADSETDEDHVENRELLAVLSPLRREDKTEIVLDDGSVWTAIPLATPPGSYDFVHVDAQGNTTTARWVRRSQPPKASAQINSTGALNSPAPSMTSSVNGTSAPDYHYTFSIINPLARRHPILASMTPHSLEIQETYTTVTSSHGRYPPTRPMSRSSSGIGPFSNPLNLQSVDPTMEKTTHPVEETTKKLITVTAIFLAMKITPTAEPRDSAELPPSETPSTAPSPPPTASAPPLCPQIKRSCTLSTPPQVTTGIPRRATSTGAAFMHRRISIMQNQDVRQSISETGELAEHGGSIADGNSVNGSATEGAAMGPTHGGSPAVKQKRRLSWFRLKFTH